MDERRGRRLPIPEANASLRSFELRLPNGPSAARLQTDMHLPGGTLAAQTENLRSPTPTSAGVAAEGRLGVVLGGWRLTRLISRSRPITIYRARPARETAGPGCYVVKTCGGPYEATLAGTLLRREARVAAEAVDAHLTSPLAAQVDHDPPCLILPYLEGVTLRQLLQHARGGCDAAPRRLPVAKALWLARQVACAQAALHGAGWLHGQVRPEHVIIAPQGHATLIDLTRARRLDSAECDATIAAPDAPAYAPPEALAAGTRLTAASDTYSLGILLFEALTGKPPFTSPDPLRLANMHRRQRPPEVRRFRPDASREVSELVQRMLAKEPLRRPSDEQLVPWLAELEIDELATPGHAEMLNCGDRT